MYSDDEAVGAEMRPFGSWLRRGNLKIVSVSEPYGDGEWMLFDVEADPGEVNDLAEEMPEVLSELVSEYDAYAADVGVLPAEQ